MGDPAVNRATLRNKFELEKRHRSYADFRSKVVNAPPEMKASSSNYDQNQKPMEMEDIIKHMKHLPGYLEMRKPIQDRALSFGVMDMGNLEKWQNRHQKQRFLGRIKCSPSSSDQSYSPAHQKIQELDSARNECSSSRNKTPGGKSSSSSSKNSDHKTSNTAISKQRSTSPFRRFSFNLSTNSKSTASISATERSESPISENLTKDGTRAHSSPLRRLLDPIFPKSHEDSRIKAKAKLDFQNSKEVKIHGDLSSSSKKQALFQTTVKNERLLFTFAVENDKDILAATVASLSSSGKDENNMLYTFFTVHEKNRTKSKDHDYVPNVAAQMKASNYSRSHCDTREFVLFSVNSNLQPQEELEAIVVKFPMKVNREENQEWFGTTVIQPGGSHEMPSKGGPSPLIYRWRSGGVCDCGGWDLGCRLRILDNQVQSSGSRSEKLNLTRGRFELFVQGEVKNKRPIFILFPLRESIFSVEYDSSLSSLQAFSICISVVECQKASWHTEPRTHAREVVPRIYTPIPRIKRNTTCKITSL